MWKAVYFTPDCASREPGKELCLAEKTRIVFVVAWEHIQGIVEQISHMVLRAVQEILERENP